VNYRDLPLELATPEALASFGELVGPDTSKAMSQTGFYGEAVEQFQKPQFTSDADTCLSVVRVHVRPLEVTWMERHLKHTQVFIPLNTKSYAVVVAPPSTSELPNLVQARAFKFYGDKGFMMNIGTWHEFPFSLDGTLDMVVILRNETHKNLETIIDGEAIGADLEKRNIQKQFGLNLRVIRQI